MVAAGNTVEDGAIAYEMGSALSDRLVHLNLVAEAGDWVQGYAVPQGLDPAVIAFIRTRPDLLDTNEAALRRGDMIACTPRSWARVSALMRALPDRSLRNTAIGGVLGEAVAAEFLLIADEIAATVQIDDLLAAKPKDRPALYPPFHARHDRVDLCAGGAGGCGEYGRLHRDHGRSAVLARRTVQRHALGRTGRAWL